MATFHQNNQKINGDQFNIGGNVVVHSIAQDRSKISNELLKILNELKDLREKNSVPVEIATIAEAKIQDAVNETKKTTPSFQVIVERLNSAKALLEGLVSASGLIKILVEAIETIKRFF